MSVNPSLPNRNPGFEQRERSNNNQRPKRSLRDNCTSKRSTRSYHAPNISQTHSKNQETSEPAMERWTLRSEARDKLQRKEDSHSLMFSISAE